MGLSDRADRVLAGALGDQPTVDELKSTGTDLDTVEASLVVAETDIDAAEAAIIVIQADRAVSVTWVVGAESNDIINVGAVFKDSDGTAIAVAMAVPWYFAGDAVGLDPIAVAPDGGVAIGTDGALIESVANLSGLAITETTGAIDMDIDDAGAFTLYVVFVLPNGTLAVSPVVTHAA